MLPRRQGITDLEELLGQVEAMHKGERNHKVDKCKAKQVAHSWLLR